MTKTREIQLMSKYFYGNNTINLGGNSVHIRSLDLLSTMYGTFAMDQSHIIDFVDLDRLKEQIDEYFEYCQILKRFRKLKDKIGEELSFQYPEKFQVPSLTGTVTTNTLGPPHFLVSGHMFYTLDDVEKAWKNKAFL